MFNEKIEIDKVYNCDCMDLMKAMVEQGIKADWLITDPPYGININNNMGRRKGDKKSDYKIAYWDKTRLSKDYFDLMFQCSKNQIIFGGNYYTDFLHPSSCWIVWDKKFSEKVSFAQIELAWCSVKEVSKKIECFPNDGADKRLHPTQKPLKVIQWIMDNYTRESDLILDPFMGSFTTAVACHKMQRHFIGAELDKEYFDLGSKRLAESQSQLSIFDIGVVDA